MIPRIRLENVTIAAALLKASNPNLKWDRQILDVLHSVNREGSYRGETNCITATSKILIPCLGHISLFMIRILTEESELNSHAVQPVL